MPFSTNTVSKRMNFWGGVYIFYFNFIHLYFGGIYIITIISLLDTRFYYNVTSVLLENTPLIKFTFGTRVAYFPYTYLN